MLRNLFLHHVAQTSPAPLMLEIDHAEGHYLHTTDGKKYLDLISGIGVSCLGHRHPVIIEAIREQTEKYLHTMVYGEYVLSPQVKLSKLLTDHLPASLDCVYFVNSGAEATEGAMKLVKRFTQRYEIIACRNAYHGSTQGAASLMSDPTYTQAYRPLLPGISFIDFNREADLEKITHRTAAVVMEVVQAEAGVRLPDGEYLLKLRRRCDEVGAMLVFDECQTGFGRTGTLFAFEQYGIVPDILTLAKGMGGGMPIGAFVSSKACMSVLSHDPVLGHITTFGGHPVSCAAALATLETLLSEQWIARVKEKEQLFRSLLQHPSIREVRSAGLLIAVELDSFETVLRVCEACLQRGLIVDWFLFNPNCLRIAPPLTITEDEIRWAAKICTDVMIY